MVARALCFAAIAETGFSLLLLVGETPDLNQGDLPGMIGWIAHLPGALVFGALGIVVFSDQVELANCLAGFVVWYVVSFVCIMATRESCEPGEPREELAHQMPRTTPTAGVGSPGESEMSEPVHRCMTKATTALGDQMKYGPNWALSRRAMLTVYPDRIECGDWTILFGEISEAVLFSIRSSLFIPGYVLRIRTEERTYHFGLNWGRYWQGELPFTVKREKGSLGYSPFSIAIRVFLLGYLAYIVWQWATS